MGPESASGPGLAEPTESPNSMDTVLGESDQGEGEGPPEWLSRERKEVCHTLWDNSELGTKEVGQISSPRAEPDGSLTWALW